MSDNYLEGLRLLSEPSPELVEYERARAKLAQPAPEPERPVCAKHDWSPTRAFPGAPHPPRSECPGCKRDADHLERKASEAGYETVERPHPQYPNKNLNPRFERAWEQHLAEKAEAGAVLPGSLAEQRAVEEADAGRKKDLERDHPTGRVAFERIEGGRVVQYFHPPRRRKAGASRGATWHESDSGEITVEAGYGRR